MITQPRITFTTIALAISVSSFIPAGQAALLTLRSGNGNAGETDSQVHVLAGPVAGEFPAPFTAADFAAAASGAAPFILTATPYWIAGLDGDTQSKWISTNVDGGISEGSTGLYAISFTLGPVSSASMEFTFAIDNVLGSAETGVNAGLFLNGTAIPGSEAAYGSFDVQYILSFPDIAALLQPGLNTLYMNAENQGAPAGFIFRAEITSTPTPEPGSAALLGLGTLGLLARRRRAQA